MHLQITRDEHGNVIIHDAATGRSEIVPTATRGRKGQVVIAESGELPSHSWGQIPSHSWGRLA
jgi:hypothetical protein